MNSMSRNNDNYDNCKKEKKACPTIIKCSCPGSTTIPALTVISTAFPVTSLTLNTSRLEDPCTKLEFASNIIATAFTGSISFQAFKICRGQSTPIPVGPSWTYSRLVAITESDTFSLFICDCDSCFDDCCTYTVVATVTAITAGVLSINNATLGAISTCSSNKCC